VETIWIPRPQLQRALERNEAFWEGALDQGPLIWVTVLDAVPGPVPSPAEPAVEAEMWTDVDYVIAAAEHALSRTYYAGDALPVYNPWLGPDQLAAWLGADILLKPKDFTSWVTPFVDDWARFPNLAIDPDNRWWILYLEIVRASVKAGRGKWITAYPDLHTGIDGLSAIRGPERLLVDLLERPGEIKRAMAQMTEQFKFVVDTVSEIVLPSGQGTSNWTMGWSSGRFLCIGQNDFTCMISPAMFDEFCFEDTLETTDYVDRSIYHLDGPDAVRHLPRILEIESLDCVQWIHGAGQPSASHWLELLKRIQDAGKSVQVYYGPSHGDEADINAELEILCRELDRDRVFFWATVGSIEEADRLVQLAAAG
jgi:succinate dehydrogenase flavin-adding protein (antitoxin of CptAB toxin-antitoxin module)